VLPAIQLPGIAWAVPTYGAMLVLTVAVCFALGPRWAETLEGLDRRAVWRAMAVLGVVTFAGGRLHAVLNHWAYFAVQPGAILRVWAGLHAGGAIIALVLAAPLAVGWQRLPLGRFADALAPVASLGVTLARLGCFLHGCCFGTTCTLPWCVAFPAGSDAHRLHAALGVVAPESLRSAPVHPLQLYFAAAGLLGTLVALQLGRQKRYHGQVALVTLVLFSVAAAGLEPLRADVPQRVYWGALPQLEWIALAMTGVAVGGLAVAELIHRRPRAVLAA
jgi:phosphatidylglycerol:prolipoprotein diacylglycerol transferase